MRPGHFQCVEDLKLCVIYMRHINERIDFSRIFFFFCFKNRVFLSCSSISHLIHMCIFSFSVAFGPKNTNYNFKLSIIYRLKVQ